MVIKQGKGFIQPYAEFESSVISYGNQTYTSIASAYWQFESSVISYGNQTKKQRKKQK